MSGRRARGLRAVVAAGGVVATAAGLHMMASGARSLPGQDVATPGVESELRFFAGIYTAYGLAMLSVAPRAHRDAAAVRALAAALFLAGAGRAAGWRAVGSPHPLQRGLLAVELVAPPIVVGWQSRVSRSA